MTKKDSGIKFGKMDLTLESKKYSRQNSILKPSNDIEEEDEVEDYNFSEEDKQEKSLKPQKKKVLKPTFRFPSTHPIATRNLSQSPSNLSIHNLNAQKRLKERKIFL